jgi:hypothetical protein
MKIFKMAAITVALVVSTSSSAALITETWQSTVTSFLTEADKIRLAGYRVPSWGTAGNTLFVAGDTFDWTVTYDDASQFMHTYYDGVNGVGEYGAGDDTSRSISCTFSATIDNCTSSYYGAVFMSDAPCSILVRTTASCRMRACSDTIYTSTMRLIVGRSRMVSSERGFGPMISISPHSTEAPQHGETHHVASLTVSLKSLL